MHLHVIPYVHMKSDITGMQEVVGKVFLYHVAFVTAADNELGDTVMAIKLHYMPQDWTPANFNHTGVSHGACASCHPGSTASGKPGTEFSNIQP